MPLTDIQIKRAKPQDKPYTLNDGQGLSLLINPDGSKAWRFRFLRQNLYTYSLSLELK